MRTFLDFGDNVNNINRNLAPLDLVLVIYCCVTHFSKTQRLETTNIYYFSISMGQAFEHDLGTLGAAVSGSLIRL